MMIAAGESAASSRLVSILVDLVKEHSKNEALPIALI